MIIYDTEVFKYDWVLCWLDTDTRKLHHIENDKDKLLEFYHYYQNTIWVGYNSRNYDTYIIKSILCGFNPYEMSDWIINKKRKGFEFSRLLNNFPILNYDCSVGFRSLKELEAFMGHNIVETEVDFNIDRKLTPEELKKTITYCSNDVMETFEIFVEQAHEYESHIGLIQEFKLPINFINKTKAQLSAEILEAVPKKRNDEFNITLPDTIRLGKYEFIKEEFLNWAKTSQDYGQSWKVEVAGVPHIYGFGGLHGAIPNYVGEGCFLMCDVASYYPAMMIEYGFLSRNVKNKFKYRQIRDERIVMKQNKDKRQQPRKIVLNSTFGASKDKYNKLYDPLQANNICITGQLLLTDLIEKLENHCQLIQLT